MVCTKENSKVVPENMMEFRNVHLPHGKFAVVIDNAFTKLECGLLMQLAHAHCIEPATMNDGELARSIRNCDSSMMDVPHIAQMMWERVLACAELEGTKFQEIDNMVPIGLNERLRMLRYSPGHFYKTHCDGEFERDDQVSKVTFQLYLNDGFEGGETRFLFPHTSDPSVAHHFDVVPRRGSVLLFEHDIIHEGCEVRDGVKWACRTDVMFAPKSKKNCVP